MRRVHLFEFGDQPWLPGSLRDGVTDLLRAGIDAFRMYHPILPLLADALRDSGESSILDLCSGGGGPLPALCRALAGDLGLDVRARLSDLRPNLAAFQQIAERQRGRVEHVREPIDATCVPAEVAGFRTLFSSFHHFRPEQARAILRDAFVRRRGIGVFEFTERSMFGVGQVLTSPLSTILLTPFIRPFRWSRLALTYALPVIPALYFFDALVSQLRTYTVDELRDMTRPLVREDYAWRIGQVRHPGLGTIRITYLLGHPMKGPGAASGDEHTSETGTSV